MAGTASRITQVDGLRAVACLLVIGFHYGVRWTPPWIVDVYYPYHDLFANIWILKFGRTHACFFFLVSGFVILLTLERCQGIVDFLRKRVARLWPTLALCASITMIATYTFGPKEWTHGPISYVLSLLFIDPSFLGGMGVVHEPQLGWVDGAYWTLGVEMRFYLLVAALYLVGAKRFLPVWLAAQVVSFVIGAPELARVHALDWPRMILQPVYLPYFTAGICFYEIHRAKALKLLPTLGLAMAAVMILVNAGLWTRFYQEPALGRTLVNAGWIALFALFVADVPVMKVFTFRPLVVLGQSSYSLFLLHESAGVALMRAFERIGVPPLVNLALVLAIMIGAALLIFRLFEEPAKDRMLAATARLVTLATERAPWLKYAPRAPTGAPTPAT